MNKDIVFDNSRIGKQLIPREKNKTNKCFNREMNKTTLSTNTSYRIISFIY